MVDHFVHKRGKYSSECLIGGKGMPVPLVTVIIPCFNSASTLRTQLEALASQIDAPEFEVLVVDNRSTDNLVQAVAAWQGRVPGLRVVAASRRQGVSYARNTGIAAAASEKLLFCDADDCVSRWWVRDGVRMLKIFPVFSGMAVELSEDRFIGSPEDIRTLVGDADIPDPEILWQHDNNFPILMGGTFGIRRDVILGVSGFDQSLPSAGEDNDLALRLRAAGYEVPDVRCASIAYRTRTDVSRAARVARRAGRAHVLVCVRHGLGGKSPLVGRGRWATNLLRTIGAALKMVLFRSTRDWGGIRIRWAVHIGVLLGCVCYYFLRRIPEPQLGVGLDVRIPGPSW